MPSLEEKISHLPRETEKEILNKKIRDLRKISTYEKNVIDLNYQEEKDILRWEKKLFNEIEKIDRIKIRSITFYPRYYLSAKGKRDFRARFGKKLRSINTNELINELYLLRLKYNSYEKTEEIIDSESRETEKLNQALKKKVNPKNGELDISNRECPLRIKVLLDPEQLRKKLLGLRKIKAKLKEMYFEKDDIKTLRVKRMILKIYQNKINQMINGIFDEAAAIKIMGEKIGYENLSNTEKRIIQQRDLFFGLKNPIRMLEKIDEFKYGSIKGKMTKNGIRIKDELIKFARLNEKKFYKSEVEKDIIVKQKGIDPDLIFQKNIKAKEFFQIAEEYMEKIGIKSQVDKEILDRLNINETAPDNKWRIVVIKKRQSMRVSNKGKCVVVGNKNKSLYEILVVLLGHEFTHVIETNNKEAIKLNIFKQSGGYKSTLFHEAGAMMMQNIVSKELFGVESLPHAHYLAAIKRKIAGGNYLECVKAFYDSCLKVSRMRLERKTINKKQFLKECLDNIEFATDRTKRIFRPSVVPLDDANQYITSSKDLLYLEQQKLTSELRKEKLEKYLLLGGINLDNLLILLKTGLLDDKKIIEPRIDLIREIWQKYKDKYEVK